MERAMSNYWSNVGSARDNSPSSNERIKTDETVSPGFYVTEVIDFGAWFNDRDRQWNCKWTLKIVEGVHRDKFLVRWSSMTQERASDNFDLFMHTMGELPVFDSIAGFSDYAAVRSQIQGAVVKVKMDIKVAQSGKRYFNVYIQQNVAMGGPRDAGAPTPSEANNAYEGESAPATTPGLSIEGPSSADEYNDFDAPNNDDIPF
jgi:hypothetical protein